MSALTYEELEEGIRDGLIKKGSVICPSCNGERQVLIENDDPDDTSDRYECCRDCGGAGFTD